MAILDAFRSALANQQTGQIDPNRIAKAVGGIAAAMDAYASDQSRALLTHIIIPWAMGVVRLAPIKWVLPSHVPPSCAFEPVEGKLCGEFAVGGCHVCGRPICVGHALIAADATIVCWPCMRLAAQHAKAWVAPTAAAPAGGGDLGGLTWAYQLLGIEPDAKDMEVKKAFKRRISQFHPDRQTGKDVAAHGEMTALITRAYEAIVATRPSMRAG